MKYDIVLARDRDGALWLRAAGRGRRRVCTATQACAILKRTKRHLYRRIADKTLAPAGKVLGEWLLDAEEVERLARRPPAVQPLPGRLAPLFPEHDLRALNAGRDRVLVLARVLESGSWADVRWLFRRYPAADLRAFLREDGSRLLSPRALALWSACLGVEPEPLPSWREADPWRTRA